MESIENTSNLNISDNMEIEVENKSNTIHDVSDVVINKSEEKRIVSFFDVIEHADDVAKTIRSQTENMVKAYETLGIAASSFVTFQDTVKEAVMNAVEIYTKVINQIDYQKITNNLLTAFQQIQQAIDNYSQKITIPSISEERKKQLLESHRIWGSYGWTFSPDGELDDLFCTIENDKKAADKKALHCIKNTEKIFNSIYSHKRVKKSDFSEAVNDFNDKRYKSCALLLFSLIDAQLIRFQRKKETQGKRREVGLGAIKKAKERIGIANHNDWFFLAMFYENLFACLKKYFADGNNFKNEPDIINRNFLNHGMSTKRVRKKDCLQLFLLYCNMLDMLDMEYKSKNKE